MEKDYIVITFDKKKSIFVISYLAIPIISLNSYITKYYFVLSSGKNIRHLCSQLRRIAAWFLLYKCPNGSHAKQSSEGTKLFFAQRRMRGNNTFCVCLWSTIRAREGACVTVCNDVDDAPAWLRRSQEVFKVHEIAIWTPDNEPLFADVTRIWLHHSRSLNFSHFSCDECKLYTPTFLE